MIPTPIAVLDQTVHAWVVAHRTPSEVTAAQLVTVLGSLPGLVVLTLLLAGLTLRTSRLGRRPLLAGLTALWVTAGYEASVVLKGLVERPRPPVADQVAPVALDPSFPSGHALSTTVLAGTGLVLWELARGRRRAHRVVPAVVTALWLLVGASRVVLGYHWPTDVVGGWLIGAVLVLLVRPLLRRAGSLDLGPAGDTPSYGDKRG